MKYLSSVFCLPGLLIAAVLLLKCYTYVTEAEKEFEELRLMKAVEYANKAAMAECIGSGDVELDYIDFTPAANPQTAIDTYKTIICLSYGMSLCEENYAYVTNFIPAMCLAVNDGFYTARLTETGKDLYDLKWSVKYPYTYDKGDGYLYMVTLAGKRWGRVNKSNMAVTEDIGYEQTGITPELITSAVNGAINRELSNIIRKRNEVGYHGRNAFYLPSNVTFDGTNPVEKITFISFVQDFDFGTAHRLYAASVSGHQVRRKLLILGWTDSAGKKYYCYEGQTRTGFAFEIDSVFDSIDQAANNGYNPYFPYIVN